MKTAESGLPTMPQKPSLTDFFRLRLNRPFHGLPFPAALHMLQSASRAVRSGVDEETVLACLLHDIGVAIMRPDHGWWGAQLVEPYVSEKVAWAIRYHQALRHYADPSVGYERPELYSRLFGEGYQPPAYIETAYRRARNHPWYMHARSVTLFDDYSFDAAAVVTIDPFADIIGRHFRQPDEGLGYDESPVAHMWRSIIDPDRPL